MPAKINLTAVTWAHAVNSQNKLTDALNSTVDMIEADIVMGTINEATREIPVMAHPPANISDLSLDSFLQQINSYNNKNSKKMKGVKLDFKSIEVFESSLGILVHKIPQMHCPIWLNADIVAGPVNETETKPVDPKRFLTACAQFRNAVLSIGWTTNWNSEKNYGYYTSEETDAMLEAIKSNYVHELGQAITFPVRAGIAANSLSELHGIVDAVKDTNPCTLTIWSSENDYVDVVRLENLIYSFGLDQIYLDVPDELSRQLNISRKNDNDTAIAVNCGSSVLTTIGTLMTFSALSGGLYALSLYYIRNL